MTVAAVDLKRFSLVCAGSGGDVDEGCERTLRRTRTKPALSVSPVSSASNASVSPGASLVLHIHRSARSLRSTYANGDLKRSRVRVEMMVHAAGHRAVERLRGLGLAGRENRQIRSGTIRVHQVRIRSGVMLPRVLIDEAHAIANGIRTSFGSATPSDLMVMVAPTEPPAGGPGLVGDPP